MRELSYQDFAIHIEPGPLPFRPLIGQIELTYRCNLDCLHCYCKGSEDPERELLPSQWEGLFDQIHREGCLWMSLTGGEPLLREDFSRIYEYAHKKGFLITLFTNGLLLDDRTLRFLARNRPFHIEITLNGISESVYEEVTGSKGTFRKIVGIIRKLAEEKLPLTIKCNGLRQNKEEIIKVKSFAEKCLGKGRFKFDSLIYPRLNGDRTPCQYRLSAEEIIAIENSDPDMTHQRRKELQRRQRIRRPAEFLYRCNNWQSSFYINPYGRIQFCHLSQKYSTDLTQKSFREGFFRGFSKILNEKFSTGSKCLGCSLRNLCYYCPARANLEVGEEETPVEYYCQLAKAKKKQKKIILSLDK
jgi:radical SAM protein with 4Fe4S-binding SPASM domain